MTKPIFMQPMKWRGNIRDETYKTGVIGETGDYTLKPGSPASNSKMGADPPGASGWKAGITP
jgi:hypothetical protein